MKRKKVYIIFWISSILLAYICISCKDYLDVVPDNIPTMDHAFQKRYQAEGFLYGCYSFLPEHHSVEYNPAFLAGDEAWLFDQFNYQNFNSQMWKIAKGEQGTSSPIANYWASESGQELNGGRPLFTGIRDCNIFLENIHKPLDMENWEKEQWSAEVKFLKAYFHFWLFRMYGPIPIIDKNLPVSSSQDEVRFYREPVDDVVEYIVELLDEASQDLPLRIEDITNYMGRATKPMALALKAQVLTYAASPLFNGNADYAEMVDNRGINLFPQDYDASKWERAADALRVAIEVSHEAGHKLYDITNSGNSSNMDDKTVLAMQVRAVVTERWNEEKIWGDANADNRTQLFGFPSISSYNVGNVQSYAPTLRVVEQFYTENGVPIEEDKNWINVDLYGLKEGDEKHKYYIEEGFETLNLHFNREPRFYGSIFFDGGLWNNGRIDDSNLWTIKLKYGAIGRYFVDHHSATGYLVKKNIHRLSSITTQTTGPSLHRYEWPVIRLADLYLMYSEVLNEIKAAPDEEVYEYIDMVRKRYGLEGVVESWANHSNQPEKPLDRDGMRDIIQRERMNELAFEGVRFWDIRRWKLSEKFMNMPIRGLSIDEDDNDFFNVREIFYPFFEKKDYFWPIRHSDILRNNNCLQSPGW